MSQMKDQLHWELQDTPRGAKILIMADNKTALSSNIGVQAVLPDFSHAEA